MTCDMWRLWLLLLWTNLLHYLNYWVSLGRFYLLDIHCDYSFISPFCGVAQTPDCGMLAVYLLFYKPFMWCRSDVRLWHALSFILHYKPFMWCRLDARLRHCYFNCILSRSHSDTRLAFSITLGFREDYRPTSFLFPMQCKFIIRVCIINLLVCIMFAFVISYVQTVLRVLS